ncbi:cell wall-binding repeat-containing protein [Peptostreptococcus sp. D1]|uniref:cell wall-binding repeat-containing protein n=1 Tax=Peptostreptococcus sp. D1 TaxID=72304 RepID=UPI0008E98E98|nr:cell wall-binding repeat-containing protein [Peptostreptococcus sp. D1]SFE48163.1 Putative cell wall-binding domain [Peptostreptococcus sp. D1]
MKKNIFISMLAISLTFTLGISSFANEIAVTRISGSDRFETNALVSKSSYSSSKMAVIASGETFADALSSGTISFLEDIPLFLSQKDSLSDSTLYELKRLGVEKVIIVGGENSISKEVETLLSKKYFMSRLGGIDRYETSEKVLRYLDKKFNIRTVGITNGNKFSDALSSVPYLCSNNGLLLLTDGKTINKDILKFIEKKNIVVFGGEKSVNINFGKKKISRIFGNDRLETAENIAKEFKRIQNNKGKAVDNLIITDGNNFPDSLSAIPLSKRYMAPIVFSNKNMDNFIKNSFEISKAIIVGGKNSVGFDIENSISKLGRINNRDNISSNSSNTLSGSSQSTENKYVNIKDPMFLKLINKNIDPKRADDQKVTKEELLKIKQLSVYFSNGKDITTIENDTDREPIIPLTKAEGKWLVARNLKSIEGIQYLKNLEAIEISECQFEDITPLKGLKKLKYIEIDRNRIKDVSPLAEMTQLEHLKLYNNLIEDVSPLANLTNLRYLDIHFNVDNNKEKGVTNIDSLDKLVNLEMFDASDNNIENADVIQNYNKLIDLSINGNRITDFTKINNMLSEMYKKQENNEGYSCGFFGQKSIQSIGKKVNSTGGTIEVDSKFRGLDEIAANFELDTMFLDNKVVLDKKNSKEKDEKIVENAIKSIVYDKDKHKYIIEINPNIYNKDLDFNINIISGIDEFGFITSTINIKQKSLNDNDIVDVDESVKESYFKIMNHYSKIEKKYSNLTDDAQNEYLPKKSSDNLTVGDLKKIKIFSAISKNIDDKLVEPLRFATNLEKFDVSLNDRNLRRELSNFEFLSNAKKLKALYYLNQDYRKLDKSKELDLSSLEKNTKLEDLRINSTETRNLFPIRNLKLTTLSLEENNISNLSPIKNMVTLRRLDLENNNITNVKDLSNLVNLETLYLYGNKITDVSPLNTLSSLEALLLNDNNISDISSLESLELKRFRIAKNPLANNYLESIKKQTYLNEAAITNITIDDFEWYKNFLVREANSVDKEAKNSEDKVRTMSFDNLILKYEVNRDKIIDGYLIIDNPLKDTNNNFITQSDTDYAGDSVELNRNLQFENGKIKVNVGSNTNLSEDFFILFEDDSNYFGDYGGQPAVMFGNVKLIINVI